MFVSWQYERSHVQLYSSIAWCTWSREWVFLWVTPLTRVETYSGGVDGWNKSSRSILGSQAVEIFHWFWSFGHFHFAHLQSVSFFRLGIPKLHPMSCLVLYAIVLVLVNQKFPESLYAFLCGNRQHSKTWSCKSNAKRPKMVKVRTVLDTKEDSQQSISRNVEQPRTF